MPVPERIENQQGRRALVDGIPFELPVVCAPSPTLMAVFTIDADRAQDMLPGNELFPLRLWNNRGLLVIAVIDYQHTTIGKYIEFSVGIGCTHGAHPAPPLLPTALIKAFDAGQFVVDLPVSSEVSVKGGKGIWGMPKHRANLDFKIEDETVSSVYELDGKTALKIEIDRPTTPKVPVETTAANFCAFRGMLMKSRIYFKGHARSCMHPSASAKLTIGTHSRVQNLQRLDISPDPLMTAFMEDAQGTLDDHIEAWFLDLPSVPATAPEGLESVVNLGLSEDWLPPPQR